MADDSEHDAKPESESVQGPMVRISVAIGGELLEAFDRYSEARQHSNRSQAVRALMRDALLENAVAQDETDSVGVVTLVYDHHSSKLAERLTEIQHEHLHRVVTTTHMHLDALRCLEVVLLRGPTREVRAIADLLITARGVETGRLTLAAADRVDRLPSEPHSHSHHGHSHGHSHSH